MFVCGLIIGVIFKEVVETDSKPLVNKGFEFNGLIRLDTLGNTFPLSFDNSTVDSIFDSGSSTCSGYIIATIFIPLGVFLLLVFLHYLFLFFLLKICYHL